MNLLKNICIDGFKSIKHVKGLALNAVNVLVGPNGAGKSNFVSFFQLLNAAMAESGINFQLQDTFGV